MFNKKQKYLFKCEKCDMILQIELDKSDNLNDIEKINKNEYVLECYCGADCYPLRN